MNYLFKFFFKILPNILDSKAETLNKVEFEVYFDENNEIEEDVYRGSNGIFETTSKSETFKDFMPKIANFFMK